MLLAQITDTARQVADSLNHTINAPTTQPEELRFGDLLMKGGWVMIPLAILLVLALVIFFLSRRKSRQ